MGYYIRALSWKKKSPQWKVQFISYKQDDTQNLKTKKFQKTWDISKERWRVLGFLSPMTIEEAKARARQLNSAAFIKKQEEKLRQLQLEEIQTQHKHTAFLPEEFVEEFEKRFLRVRDSETARGLRKFSRAHIIWRAAQQLIINVKLDPSEWFDNSYVIYDYFYEKKFSMSYINKILSLTNLWGYFICRKFGKPFLAVRYPKGYERQRLVDTYYQKENSRRFKSQPLTPDLLKKTRNKMKPKQFNWLFISVWLGLRPQEIDNLKNKELWNIEIYPSKKKILWIYQTKIVSLPPEERWKAIPIIYDEQKFALKIIKSGNFERPVVKTLRKYLGENMCLYGGRKGFTDLMLEKGHSLEAVSQWMGHSTIGRTWRSYKDRRGVKFSLVF